MFARKLTPAEYWRAGLNMAVAFEGPFDFEKEQENSQTAQVNPKQELYGSFMSENEPPVASLVMNRKQMRFDGHMVKMAGVGGVATLPANRRGGAIRACMELSLRDFYNEGYAFSHLYPFSTAYYRQFGFAAAGHSVSWKVKISELRGLPKAGGSVRQLLPGDDLSPLLDIYNEMYKDVNFACARETFNRALDGDKPLAAKRWVFLWVDDSGVPGGFIVATRDKDTLHCVPGFPSNDVLLFKDTRALCGLLNFVYSAFIANFEDIQFCLPDHMDLTGLLPELSGMNCKHVLNGMTRVLNVEEVLRLCRCRGEGRVSIKVTDNIIKENNDTFTINFMPGAENKVERAGAVSDIELDVGSLGALLGGCRGAESLCFMPDVTVNNKDMAYDGIFYKKPCHLLDLF